ncbi:MAG: phosphoribosylformylglycinamidine cyclo-ligase [Bdellovibrionia bacterium]
MAAIDYADSGVNRALADQFVDKIALLSKPTLNRKVKSAVGGYASLYVLDKKRLLAASTDGVGTKLKLAIRLREHRTVGIDLVAMSVNDLLCVGAEPLFFLDYFATGKLDAGVAEGVLSGIVEGCKQAQCALVGGETAEMPDFYATGEYDLAGFAVGLVDSGKTLPKKKIRPGDTLIGIGSTGCHSNGYSLLRKLLPEGKDGDSIARELLTPTRIYARSLLPLIQAKKLKGLAHITGSGFLNVPRMSEAVSYSIHLPPQKELPKIYDWVRSQSGLSLGELAQTFNLGIGMVAVVAKKNEAEVLRKLKRSGEKAWVIGEVVKRRPKTGAQVFLNNGEDSVTLTY